MKKKTFQILKYLFFLALGVFLFWFVYKDQDINHIKNVLKSEVDYRWMILTFIITLISHYVRSVRWNLVLDTNETKSGRANAFLSVMVGYMMNLVLPRMGEISRCGTMARYDNKSFSKVLGTVITERMIDVVILLIFTAATVLLQFDKIFLFLTQTPEVRNRIEQIFSSPGMLLLLVSGVALPIFFRKKILQLKHLAKIKNLYLSFKEGILSIRHIEKKGLYIFYSFLIWILYFLMGYVFFQCFSFSKELSILCGLTVFVLGSFGMAAPVQAGIGAWHFMTIEALALYGITKTDGMIYALLMHTSINAGVLIVGILALLVLPIINRNNNSESSTI